MDISKEKTVGIIGGMGPQATVDLMQRIISMTPANDDIDHIRCIVDNNPKIPSRIKAIIEGNGESPVPCLVDMAERLEAHGADLLAIACNTAHHYYSDIQRAVRIPVIHMVESVLEYLKNKFPDITRVGVLASPAIQITRLYENIFLPAGLAVEFPDPDFQDSLFETIRRVKAGTNDKDDLKQYEAVCRNLKAKGCGLGIAACTELSALNLNTSFELVDAAQILAQKIITLAKTRR